MKKNSILLFILFAFLLSSGTPLNIDSRTNADDEDYPIYIVQPGDNLDSIALEFGVDIDELIALNEIDNPNAIGVGTELILPGLEGITGVLTTIDVGMGETLNSLSIRSGVDPAVLMKINKLSSPVELYYQANIIIPLDEEDDTTQYQPIAVGGNGSTLLEQAVRANTTQWQLTADNHTDQTWAFLPNQIIFQESTEDNEPGLIPGIQNISISPDEIYQGNMITMTVQAREGITPMATLNDRALPFYPTEPNTFEALQGIDAMHDVGLDQLDFSAMSNGKEMYRFQQHIITYETYYPSESIVVNPITLDPATQAAEDELIRGVVSQITEEKYWDQPFLCVVDQPACIRSWYGTNRNYNDGLYYNFHSGLDYGVCATLNIYAPADGVVALTDSLTIRGNATYIDHGYGVYSAFFHQSEIWVKEGDVVKAGDIIGQIGTTGRSTGAHLHYDLIVNGEQINPLIWLPIDCQ